MLAPEEESAVITKLLTYWAMQSTLLVTDACAYCGLPRGGVPHVHGPKSNALKEPAHG